jgi:predicted PurR-regulated permease PerM
MNVYFILCFYCFFCAVLFYYAHKSDVLNRLNIPRFWALIIALNTINLLIVVLTLSVRHNDYTALITALEIKNLELEASIKSLQELQNIEPTVYSNTALNCAISFVTVAIAVYAWLNS